MAKYSIISIITAIAALCILPCNAGAQQKIDPTVEVQRDFDGRMINIHKSRLLSHIDDSLSNFDLSFNYSIFDKPYKDLYEFSPLPSAELQNKVEEKYPVFLAKAGAAFPLAPFADICFQPHLKGGNTLHLNALYTGFYGKLGTMQTDPQSLEITKNNNAKAYAGNTHLGLGANYGYHWRSGALSFGIGYNANSASYYGFNYGSGTAAFADNAFLEKIQSRKFMKESSSHQWQQLDAKFSIGSLNAKGRGAKLHYRADVSYSHTADKYRSRTPQQLKENYIRVSGEVGPTFGRYNKFTIGFNSENVLYSGVQEYKYGLYEIIPQYSFEKGRLKIDAGIKISGRYKSKDDTDMYHNTFFAKADLSFEIARNNLWLYAGIDGGNLLNSYSSLLAENRWISQTADLKAGSVPFLFKGGLKGQIHNKFSYNVYARYTVHEGLVQYIGCSALPEENYESYFDNRLYTVYSNHRQFTVGGELKWESKEVTAGTVVEYSNYTKSKGSTLAEGMPPIGYAPFQWYLYGKYNYRQRIWVEITSDFRSSTPTWSSDYPDSNIKCRAFLNLGINAGYSVNRNLSIFINGENLLNSQMQYYPQYAEKGISFGAGILVKL